MQVVDGMRCGAGGGGGGGGVGSDKRDGSPRHRLVLVLVQALVQVRMA